ncbi:ribonuclease H-like domain-containing protein [Tanacetum coccineum]
MRRTDADFSHAPLNEYSPSPDDKKQWSLVWFDFYKIPLCTLMTINPNYAYYNGSRQEDNEGSKLECTFQDQENSQVNSSALESGSATNGIQCFNCKGFGHYARECRKPKRVKDYAYHKEKMMMCKQAEQGVPLQAEQADWLEDTDEEIDEQELEAHYSFMAKIQEVSPEETSSSSQPWNRLIQNAVKCVDERVALANLIVIFSWYGGKQNGIKAIKGKQTHPLIHELEKWQNNLMRNSRGSLGRVLAVGIVLLIVSSDHTD